GRPPPPPTFPRGGRNGPPAPEPQRPPRPVGNVGIGTLVLRPPAPREHPERQDEPGRDERVQGNDDREREPDAAVTRDGVLRAQGVVHDPRLATDLGDEPARLDG